MSMLEGLPRRRRRPDAPVVTQPSRRVLSVADPADADVTELAEAGREVVEVLADDPTVLYVVEPVPLTSGLTGELVTRDELDAALAALEAELRAEIDDLADQLDKVHETVSFPTPLTQWIATHSLGRRPVVAAIDTTGAQLMCEVSYPALHMVVIDWSAPTAGSLELR